MEVKLPYDPVSPSVSWAVGRSVIISEKGGKFHFHAPTEHLFLSAITSRLVYIPLNTNLYTHTVTKKNLGYLIIFPIHYINCTLTIYIHSKFYVCNVIWKGFIAMEFSTCDNILGNELYEINRVISFSFNFMKWCLRYYIHDLHKAFLEILKIAKQKKTWMP